MGERVTLTSTLPISLREAPAKDSPILFPGIVGFFFVFRVCLTFLFFQGDPVLGTIVNIAIGLVLLYGAIFYTADSQTRVRRRLLKIQPIRWVFALLALSVASALWTGAQSIFVALVYWASMAADVAIVLLLLRHEDADRDTEAIMKGVVWGAAALAIIAWCSPATADLRLGNDTFLHPNTLGLEIGIATLIAQYLVPRGPCWKWLGVALAITLLRTLSKTAIIAFVIAECWYLMQSHQMPRKAKVYLVIGTLIVVASFWGLLSSYIDIYSNTGSGDQAETLTGRTLLWTVAFSMGLEKPWLGHGLYSFKALIPMLGTFEAVHAHNDLLQQFFELGVAGVVIVLGVYWSFYRQTRRVPASEMRTLALALLLFALVRGLTDSVQFGLSYPLWLLAAFSICLYRPADSGEQSSC
jgi:exopolysaccharide production protein ExoQ